MLVLFETPAGYAVLKVLDKGKLEDVDNIHKLFESAESAKQVVKLKAFSKFEDTAAAVSAASAICDGTLDKGLKKFLKNSELFKKEKVKLAVVDTKLGGLIKEKLGIKCVSNKAVEELFRGIRQQMDALLTGLTPADAAQMKLGLAHSLSRHKLKFSPDKVDTMIVQAISLLDELDKELNTYAMRVREWYGWHFPEMSKVVTDNILYAKTVLKMGVRTAASSTDLSEVLPEDVEKDLKEAAEVSMGTEIAEEDISNIKQLAEQVVSIQEYRTQLWDYLRNRMNAIAPNLTVMVGELVGARLIAHAGSLMNLAKHPASTVQILGAEKALFRALKTKHDTPKYGLIYHASLVGQAAPKLKGKVARVLAAKAALSIRMDALGETDGVTIGVGNRDKVEERIKSLDSNKATSLSGNSKGKAKQTKYTKPQSVKSYNSNSDATISIEQQEPANGAAAADSDKKKEKKRKREEAAAAAAAAAAPEEKSESTSAVASPAKEKKQKTRVADAASAAAETPAAPVEKKKKKKDKSATES